MVANILGKPESYVMVILKDKADMLFAGDATPLAYLELKSLGLPEERTPDLSAALCSFMETRFGIPPRAGLHRVRVPAATSVRVQGRDLLKPACHRSRRQRGGHPQGAPLHFAANERESTQMGRY